MVFSSAVDDREKYQNSQSLGRGGVKETRSKQISNFSGCVLRRIVSSIFQSIETCNDWSTSSFYIQLSLLNFGGTTTRVILFYCFGGRPV